MREAFLVLDLATSQTLAVIHCVADLGTWDRRPGVGILSLREQLQHVALVRESILCCLAGVATTGLGRIFEGEAWLRGTREDLAEAFQQHSLRCHERLKGLHPGALDEPFTTPFGNRSTPRNYLRVMLLEETHHRAQMTLSLRLFGLEPPAYPGRAWVELGVPQA